MAIMSDVITLLNALRSGKKHAERDIYVLMKKRWMGICLRYCHNEDDAKDIFQEGVIKIFREIDRVRNPAAFEGWARRILINQAIDFARSKKLHWFSVESNSDSSEINEPIVDSSISDLDSQKIVEVIASLPPGYQMVFNLSLDGYDHREISEILHISESTSRSQLTKAKKLLRKLLTTIDPEYHEKTVGL